MLSSRGLFVLALLSAIQGIPGTGLAAGQQLDEVLNLNLSGGAQTSLSWDAVQDATGYDVLASDSASYDQNQDFVAIAHPATVVEDAFVPSPGQVRYYLVRARNADVLGPWGARSDGLMRTPVLLPAPPVLPGLALLVGTDVDEISVVWRPAFDDSTPTNALGYEVHVSENPNFEPSPVTLAGTFWGTVQGTVDGLQPNTTYHVLAVAVDGDGLGSLEREYRSVGTPEFPVVLSATTPLEDAESFGLGEPVVDGSQLTFTPSGPATLPTVGAVLFGHVAELGYLRRVDSVEDTGDQVIVQTSDASLSDFVDQMSLSMNVVLFEADPE